MIHGFYFHRQAFDLATFIFKLYMTLIELHLFHDQCIPSVSNTNDMYKIMLVGEMMQTSSQLKLFYLLLLCQMHDFMSKRMPQPKTGATYFSIRIFCYQPSPQVLNYAFKTFNIEQRFYDFLILKLFLMLLYESSENVLVPVLKENCLIRSIYLTSSDRQTDKRGRSSQERV